MEYDLPTKLPVTTVPIAGKAYYGLGTSASYEAARRGEIPTIRIGRRLVVPLAAMEKRLADADKVSQGSTDDDQAAA